MLAIGSVTACAIVLLAVPGRGAVTHDDPRSVVGYVGAQGMAALGPTISPAQRIARLRQLFAENFDTAGIAEFALGPYRRSATPQQQQEFFRLYQDYTVRTYDAQLGQYGAAPFQVTGGRSDGERAVVTSEIIRPGGNHVQIDWHLVNRQGQYKINDLIIAGISMKLTQRDEFARWIQNNGGRFDAFLSVLRQQTR